MYLLTAISAFFSILFNGNKKKLWIKLNAKENQRAKEERAAKKEKKSGEEKAGNNEQKPENPFPDSVYTLVLLQREGRLIDFLMEDISKYSDEQVGGAARQIHAGGRKVMDENFSLEPIFPDASEGEEVEIKEGFDPDEFELTGSVSGKPPFNGTLRHKGWKSAKINLPSRQEGKNPDIICPAEVEI
ncbi:MAG: DUF2760 domain-containing protein [Nitrospinota bacterium]